MKRRGFIGALLAVIAAPRALFAKIGKLGVVESATQISTSFVCEAHPSARVLVRRVYRSTPAAPEPRLIATIVDDRFVYHDNFMGADAVHPARALTSHE